MITVSTIAETNVLVIQAMDHLVASDYEILAAKTKELLERYDRINMLFEMREFKGWSVGAMWQDLKFDIRHFKDVERLAFVGDKKWEKGAALLCKPFTAATVRYFDLVNHDEAVAWVQDED